ncbi:glycosyltransferase [Patescibacteria group bacterium]|nr:glycosyltransferase [Patescibacteria group bacterium]
MQKNNITVSVAICTYNRSKYLQTCLDSLAHQENVDPKDYELLIIDNNSTDNTKDITTGYINKYPSIKIRYHLEQKIGLSHARNKAIKEARGKYIAYIDDDGIAYPDWIYQIIEFTRRHPHIMAFGGPSYRYAEIPIPKWAPPDYGNVDLGDKEKEVTKHIVGCNMIFKKSLFEKLDGFNPSLGMVGKSMGYGEEDEIFIKMIKFHLPMMYSPHIKIKHLLPSYKLNMFWELKSRFIKVQTLIFSQKRLGRDLTNFTPTLQKLLSFQNLISKNPIENKIYNILLAFDIIVAMLYANILNAIKKFKK